MFQADRAALGQRLLPAPSKVDADTQGRNRTQPPRDVLGWLGWGVAAGERVSL
jgi:hypothetical protein